MRRSPAKTKTDSWIPPWNHRVGLEVENLYERQKLLWSSRTNFWRWVRVTQIIFILHAANLQLLINASFGSTPGFGLGLIAFHIVRIVEINLVRLKCTFQIGTYNDIVIIFLRLKAYKLSNIKLQLKTHVDTHVANINICQYIYVNLTNICQYIYLNTQRKYIYVNLAALVKGEKTCV